MEHNTRWATVAEIRKVLRERPFELFDILKVPYHKAQMSMPTDGKGARIRVAVRGMRPNRIAKEVVLAINDQHVKIPIEATADYEEFVAL